jgi:uncharacterized protein (UPF0335 family)
MYLVGAARPASNDDTGEGRGVQSLDLAMMRPEGAFVWQHLQKPQAPQNSYGQNRSSMLQVQQRDPNNTNEQIDEQDLSNGEVVENQDDVNETAENTQNGLHVQAPVQVQDGTQNDEAQNRVNSNGLQNATADRQDSTESQRHNNAMRDGRETQHNGQVDNTEEDNVPALTPGEEVKMFRTANEHVGEMEDSANKLQGHLSSVDGAWGTVDGKLTEYHESVENMGNEVKKLTDSVHGLHDEVKTEFWDKEKIRMCIFMNAKRVLKGEPEVDCKTTVESIVGIIHYS